MERTLLLVDDEANILKALTRTLRNGGYRVLAAGGGEEALALLADHDVGVMVSDQRMPGMTGSELLNKAKELYPDTVRIMLSGYTDLGSVTDAINTGAIFKFLTKPWDDDLLRANIEEAFTYRELHHENQRLALELAEANRDLERRVDEKTREALLSVRTLKVAQEVLERLPVGVVGMDADGTIVVVNKMAQELLHLGGGRLAGRSARDALPAALHGVLAQKAGDATQGVRVETEHGPLEVFYRCLGNCSETCGQILVCMPVGGA